MFDNKSKIIPENVLDSEISNEKMLITELILLNLRPNYLDKVHIADIDIEFDNMMP